MSSYADQERQLKLANKRLNDRTAAVEQRLASRLNDVQEAYQLTLPSLLSEQRKAHRADANGLTMTATTYWQDVAEPRAAQYVDKATAVIDQEFTAVADAVKRFQQSIRNYSNASGQRSDRSAVSNWISDAVEPLLECVPTADQINQVGEKWQQKLHRAAIVRSLPELLLNPQTSARDIIARTEMDLLEKGPWVHGDRMLSAFELATSDIRNYLADELRRVAAPQHPAKPKKSDQVLILG